MMEQSSRFISLSGWSGVLAGIYALIASGIAYNLLGRSSSLLRSENLNENLIQQLFFLGMITLVLAISTGVLLSIQKSKKKNLKVWTKTTRRLLIHLSVPLAVGGLFVLALYLNYSSALLVAPTTLIFYGLALINSSKFTFQDVAYLGYCEVILGLTGLFFPGYGLFLWAIGFGVLHIIYGILIQRKYH